MISPRSAMVVLNPAARQAPSRDELEAAVHAVMVTGWQVEIREAGSIVDTEQAGREAVAAGVDAVLACGGDGTLNSVLRGILLSRTGEADKQPLPCLGVIPCGTANVWGEEAGIPRHLARAIQMLDRGLRRRADVGRARIGSGAPYPFLLMCSAGLDARVVEAVDRRSHWKRRLGRAAFAWPALRAIADAVPIETRIEIDGASEVLRIHEAVAGNTRLYGSVTELASAALLDDGLLDLVTFEGHRGAGARGHAFRLALRAMRGGLADVQTPGIRYRRGASITLDPEAELPVQADGEFIGTARPGEPLHLDVEPAAITLIIGTKGTQLFQPATGCATA